MKVRFFGGPLDGAVFDTLNQPPQCFIVKDCDERPVYKARCCGECSRSKGSLSYQFLGYEGQVATAPSQSRLGS